MQRIQSFVFFDLETTGLPHQERNRTKITELCFIAVSRKDIEKFDRGDALPTCKLSLLFDPQKEIDPVASSMTGLTRDYLKNCRSFAEHTKTISIFLEDLRKPVCLIAHNGNAFDFKILQTEFKEANYNLPVDILCVDSKIGFQKLLKCREDINYHNLSSENDILTDDDDDEFPVLNISNEEWREIDKINASFSDMYVVNTGEIFSLNKVTKKECYSLTALYKRLLNKDALNAHRAEADCLMLLECVVALKHMFLHWADESCKKISEIKPFIPH